MGTRAHRTLASIVVIALASLTMVLAGAETAGAAPTPQPPDAPTTYRPLVPARLLDTRPGAATIDGLGRPGQPLGTDSTLHLQVLSRGGVPASDVSAIVINVTATNPTAGSYLTVWPSGLARPTASNLNFVAGQTVPNLVVAKLGTAGSVDIYNYAGRTDVIVDIAGYYPVTDTFTPVVPARLLDTRRDGVTIDGSGRRGSPVHGGESIDVVVNGRGGVPGDGVGAVVLNVTATNVQASSFLTVWPTGQAQPTASNVNMRVGDSVPNLVVVKVGAAGSVSVFNYDGDTDVVIDVAGYFPLVGSYVPLDPARILETRVGRPAADGGTRLGRRINHGETLDFRATGVGGIPAGGVAAVVLNVTAVAPSEPTYLTVWPAGSPRPNASNLNLFRPDSAIPNLVVAKVGPDGRVSVYNDSGNVDLVVDVSGYFLPSPTSLRDVITSSRSTCALLWDGTFGCWGAFTPQGANPTFNSTGWPLPEEITGFDDVVDVSLGGAHTCILRVGGAVWCWGTNFWGVLGDGTNSSRWLAAAVPGLSNVVDIESSFLNTCALTSAGTVYCWGLEYNGGSVNRPKPVPGLNDIVQIATGDYMACARHQSGTVACWGGILSDSVLGDGSTFTSATPVNVSALTDADSIVVSGARACATRISGGAVCWGGPYLGSGATTTSPVPVPVTEQVSGQPVTDIVQIDGGDDFQCALRSDLRVYCFGSEYFANLGIGQGSNTSTTRLGAAIPGLPSIIYLTADRFHICAVALTSAVYCWGRNEFGQVGNGSFADQVTPRRVL